MSMPFNFLYLLFQIISKQLYTLPPMTNKFHTAVTEELHTLFPKPDFDSPFQFFIQSILMSTKVLFQFWKHMKIHGAKSGLYGGCGRMVRFNLPIASIVAQHCTLQQNILLVPLNPCQLLFQSFECRNVSSWVIVVPGSRKSTWITPSTSQKTVAISFPTKACVLLFYLKVKSLWWWYSTDWPLDSGL
jgi:hypothetical protein